MREIKFRAWDTKRNKMWSAEEMAKDQLTLMPDGSGFINVSGDSIRLSQSLPHLIPLQFTGLKDKNGTEGYASDVVSFGSTRPLYLIKWSVCNACFYLESIDEQKECLVICNFTVGEIIGDIHTKPKLMEQENE